MAVDEAPQGVWELVPLTPTFMEAEHGQYASAIVKALDDPLVRNIALSGNYGVGKSSILQEVSRLKGEEVVELSLSTLAPIEQSDLDDSVPRQATTPTNRIQQEIVKQLLYREEPERAAGSRFRRIERFSVGRETLLAGLAGIVITVIFLIAGWGATITKTLDPLIEIGLWGYPGILVVAGGAAYLARWLLHGRIHIKQFSAGPAAVTLDEKSVSYFDQYLDEIVYFFETSKHRIVIFEDIDRFNDSHIFETLRSLNTLLNAAPQIKDRPIRFIYAIKDSIFDRIGLEQEGRKPDAAAADLDPAQAESVRANRTKFFDLVIPVVPFITHRSARSLTTQILRGIDHEVDADLIDLAGRFVPDMRLLKNVRNEFVVFRDRIFSGDGEALKLSETDLFAMMLYKSTHLSDFEVIRLGKSKLDRLYEASRSLVVSNVARIESEIRVSRQQLARAGSVATRAKRLGDRLIARIDIMIRAANLNRYSERYEYAGAVRAADYFRTAAFWKEFVEGDGASPVVWRSTYNGGIVSLSRADAATILGDALDSDSWKEVDRDAANERIAEREEELLFLRSADMGDLIKRPECLVEFEGKELSLADVAEKLLTRGLAFELIRAGYIDRNFTLYTSTFHGDRVSSGATNFMIHHVERGLMDEHFVLDGDDVDAVVRERGSRSLADPAFFNIAILDRLLQVKGPSLEEMVTGIARLDTDARRFLQSYLSAGTHASEIVGKLTIMSPRTLTYLVSEVELDDDVRLRLVSACLEALSDGARLRTDDPTRKFLAANYAQLNALSETSPSSAAARRIAELFSTMGLRLPDLRPLTDRVRRAFVSQGLYELNLHNLVATLGDGASLSLDAIREHSPEHVYVKVLAELPRYLTVIDGHAPANESGEQFAGVLADVHQADSSVVEAFIAAASTESVIADLADVSDETWSALAKHNRFLATYENVTNYIEHAGGVDAALARVLKGAETLSDVEGADQDDKQSLAVTLISAATLLGPVIRAKLVESLKLDEYVAVSGLPKETGALFGELRSRDVVADDADTYAHVAELDWATKEGVLRASPRFGEWATPDLVAGDLGSVLASTAVEDDAKRIIVKQADAYAPAAGPKGLAQLARLALDFRVTVGFGAIVQMAASRVSADRVIRLLQPYLKNATADHLHRVLENLGGEYAKLTRVGYDKPKILNSTANLALLDELHAKGFVASFDRTQDPIKVNKRLK
ncbi:hypothetical protein CH252_06955 [Rhodococcus sp. 06-1477-1B]|nr:hypothetical protein CH252_06955 [Rhodococcus sp. 06-1477-1B]